MYTDALQVLLRFIYFTQTRLGKRHGSNPGWCPDGISPNIANGTDSSIIFISDTLAVFPLNLRVSFTGDSYTFSTWLRCTPWGLQPFLHFYGNLWILLTPLPISCCNCRSPIILSFQLIFFGQSQTFISRIIVSLPTELPLATSCVSEAENGCSKRCSWRALHRDQENYGCKQRHKGNKTCGLLSLLALAMKTS